MIQIIGVKRILILIMLLSINAALAAASYLYVIPQADTLARQLRSTQSQISKKRSDTDQLRNEFDIIQKKKEAYENLKDSGFISEQNRITARRRVTDIQRYTGVLRANYNINQANVVHSKTTDEIGYVVLESPVSLSVDAVDDIDFFSFMYWMETAFPGHMSINKVHLMRGNELNDTSLRAIGSGEPVPLVKGNIDMVWRTITPQAAVQGSFATEGF